ncbi:hypothetical protein AAG906_007959 [Vitis piasezkii]
MKVGGRAWFGIESKSFEISVELSKGKWTGVITERGRNFSSWIRFGERGLSLLLEGVEECCQKENFKEFKNSWVEEGRTYKPQLHSNEAGRYLLCLAFSAEANRIDAFKGEHGQGQGSLEAIPSFKQGSVSEEVWLQYGGVNSFNKLQFLNRCLVGKWGDVLEEGPLLSSLEDWTRYHQRLKGSLSLFPLGGSWILFEFELAREAERELQEGCLSESSQPSSHWVRIVGLPLCLWHRDFFRQVGDVCGGHLWVDEETMGGRNLQWARTPPWVVPMVPCAQRQEVWEKKGYVSRTTNRIGIAGPNPTEELSPSSRTRPVEGAASLAPLVGRLQREV